MKIVDLSIHGTAGALAGAEPCPDEEERASCRGHFDRRNFHRGRLGMASAIKDRALKVKQITDVTEYGQHDERDDVRWLQRRRNGRASIPRNASRSQFNRNVCSQQQQTLQRTPVVELGAHEEQQIADSQPLLRNRL